MNKHHRRNIVRIQHSVYEYLSGQLDALEFGRMLTQDVNQWRSSRTNISSQISDIASIVACQVLGGDTQHAFPITAYWILCTLAFRLLDNLQDAPEKHTPHDRIRQTNTILCLQSTANLLLAKSAEMHSYQKLVKRCTVAVAGLTWAQNNAEPYQLPTKPNYFLQTLYKTANIVGTALWTGGCVAHDNADDENLNTLNDFGIATGIMAQIEDDCRDLHEDIRVGHYTLPVICALSNQEDSQKVAYLSNLLVKSGVDNNLTDEIYTAVVQLGGVKTSQKVASNYREQSLQIITHLPPNPARTILAMYVSPQSEYVS